VLFKPSQEYPDEPLSVDGVYRSVSGLNYTDLYFYQKKYYNLRHVASKIEWIREYWWLSIIYALVYLVLVFAGQRFMRDREKFELRRALIAWNLTLAGFSALGAFYFWPEFAYTLTHHGFDHSICVTDYNDGIAGCWAWMFVLSKVPELFDTFFIVARKQELIFLHW